VSNYDKLDPPKPDTGDTAHLVTKGVLSIVPGASELFEFFVKPPLEDRLEEWMENVAEVLRDLAENKNYDLEELQQNQEFITIVAQATQIAIRNHQKYKIKSLRNVISNSIVYTDIRGDLKLLFIRYIDELTPTHLKLLNFFIENETAIVTITSYPDLYELFNNQYPQTISKSEFRLMCQDISARGLIRISPDIEDFNDIYQASSLLLEETNEDLPMIVITDIAVAFLDFIEKKD
jgi:hypothetical protein